MKKIFFKFLIGLFILVLLGKVNVWALESNIGDEVAKISNTDGSPFFQENIGSFASLFLNVALVIGALACLFFLIMGGIAWVTSSGDKQKIEEARNQITSGIVGLAILASVFVIWTIVLKIFGLDKSDLLKVN